MSENREQRIEEMPEECPHKLLFVKTKHKTVEERGNLYEAARWSWIIDPKRAEQADYVLAVINGICKGVFKAEEWKKSDDFEGRWQFEGYEVEDPKICEIYIDKRPPKGFYRQQNPIGYRNC